MEEFRKKYPNLTKELENEGIQVDSVRSLPEEAEKAFHPYEPTVIDFLRRCDTEEQGLEIINYLKKRNEISEEYANELKIQLLKKGIRSFGPKKEKGYYGSFR
ncbi:MAG: DUF2095 family protein [Methanobacteriota archaeon]|jgi:hypothetical protein